MHLVFNAATNNVPPVAVNDTATTAENMPIVVPVLVNDSNPDGGPLSIPVFNQGASGSVSSNGDGTLTYTPNNGFVGADSFSYTISDDEGGAAQATVFITVNPPAPVLNTLPVATEANIRGGSYATTPIDEIAQGYLMVKFDDSALAYSRKGYFQFDLAGLNVFDNTSATFVVTSSSVNFEQRAQLWGLNQAYSDFTTNATWDSAQANDTNSDDLLTNGTFTATPIGASQLLSGSTSVAYTFTVPVIEDYLVNNQVTLALSAVNDPDDNSGGLRLAPFSAVLQVLTGTASTSGPITNKAANVVMAGNGGVTIGFVGTPSAMFYVQATTNLSSANWATVSTNVSGTNGVWTFTDTSASNYPARFYRTVSSSP